MKSSSWPCCNFDGHEHEGDVGDESGGDGDPRCRASFLHWQPGTYSLVSDILKHEKV